MERNSLRKRQELKMAAKIVLLWKSAGVSPWAQYRQLPKITHFWENYVIDDAASMRTLTSGHFY